MCNSQEEKTYPFVTRLCKSEPRNLFSEKISENSGFFSRANFRSAKRERTPCTFERRKLASTSARTNVTTGSSRSRHECIVMSFDGTRACFWGRNSRSISINRQRARVHGWEVTEATRFGGIGTAAYHGRNYPLRRRDSSYFRGRKGRVIAEGGNEDMEDGKSCAGARAFNKVLRFFSRGKLVYGSSGMSNGCRGIACRFTHQANFPAYCGAIFLPFPRPSSSGASSRCSYFTFALLSLREFFISFVSLRTTPPCLPPG